MLQVTRSFCLERNTPWVGARNSAAANMSICYLQNANVCLYQEKMNQELLLNTGGIAVLHRPIVYCCAYCCYLLSAEWTLWDCNQNCHSSKASSLAIQLNYINLGMNILHLVYTNIQVIYKQGLLLSWLLKPYFSCPNSSMQTITGSKVEWAVSTSPQLVYTNVSHSAGQCNFVHWPVVWTP